ncbi:glycosyltransferase WbuB [Pseudomonas neustonica]|uniref:Glycosyltransferase WbuB n=1 Tax=Pseudomonas neustonica TaxID=2487346 RepID=A0ABX9XG34_9PSED|nr:MULTISPECIES: glycosyltransferase family 4 protein [Pseudomonas]ROZ80438.1 glycosyltransferase WbuB [Pseudomonas sp. SSM44]ROZ81204.1 glycosyltransferase WbuB [Pseudomonas neustonica]
MKTIWIINQYASTPDVGVGGRHYYLANELAKLGYKVYVIASASSHLLRQQPTFSGTFHVVDVTNSFSFVWVKLPRYEKSSSKQRALNWFLFGWQLQKLTKVVAEKPDVILHSSPSLVPFLGAQRLAKKLSARLVFEVRDIWPLTLVELGGYSRRHPFIQLMLWIERKAYRDSDKVVSNLRNAVDHMVKQGMSREKFSWVPNGVSLEEVAGEVPLDESVKALLPKNKFMVGYTGTIGLANSIDTRRLQELSATRLLN